MNMKKTAAALLALITAGSAMTMPVSALQFVGGDIDGDGKVSASDAAWILQYAAYVGSGGTDSIYEFVPLAETEPVEPEKPEGVTLPELSGLTLTQCMDAGYELTGYLSYNDVFTGYVNYSDYTNDEIKKLVASFEGKTVAEMVEEHDIRIGYFGVNGNYTFTTYVGSLHLKFDLEHGAQAVEIHKDESFFDLEEAAEVQADTLNNVELDYVDILLDFDEASTQRLLDMENKSTDKIKAISDELVVERAYYRTSN